MWDFLPFVGDIADVRDVFANAAYGNWGITLLSATGVVTNFGNVTKTGEKLADFIKLKGIANVDDLMPFLVKLATKHPEWIPKLLPTELADELLVALKENGTYSKTFYEGITEIIVRLGKEVPTGLEKFQNVQKLTFEGVNPWELPPLQRGQLIDKLLGNNLGATAKTYDILEGTVATSIKSIDVGCNTYQTASGFEAVLRKYANDLKNGANYVMKDGTRRDIEKKVLCLVFPDMQLKNKQIEILEQFIEKWSKVFDIEIKIVP